METRASKRLRKNDDNPNVERPWVKPGSSKATSRIVKNSNTIPTLASEVFLASLRDVRMLAVCRLVCKSWNIVATESLRACSVVRLKEGGPNVAKFAVVLLGRCVGQLEQLPSPFKSFHFGGMTFTDQTFINLILLPNIEVTSLEMKLDNGNRNIDLTKLGLILASHKTNITDLSIGFEYGNLGIDGTFSANGEIQLMSLKYLKFKDNCKPCTHIPFMKNILRMCNLERLDLNIRDGDLLINLLSREKVKNLKHFEVHFKDMSSKALRHLCQLRFLRLKNLAFIDTHQVVDEVANMQQWQLFCKNVSSFVENFNTNVQLTISTNSELIFPNLKEIAVCRNTNVSCFTSNRFPSLSKVRYSFNNSTLRTPENESAPHEGVKSIYVVITGETMRNFSFDHNLMMSLTYLSRQFPNVSSLEFSVPKFRDFTIGDICEAFPKLTAIVFDGDCNFFSLSGVHYSTVTKYLAIGRPIEKIPRRKSIMDLMDLQVISFGPKFVVQPDMIIHCLPRITKLKHVSLHWNVQLSAPLLRDSLGKLEKIGIMNSSESKFQDAMAQVSKMLPNVYME